MRLLLGSVFLDKGLSQPAWGAICGQYLLDKAKTILSAQCICSLVQGCAQSSIRMHASVHYYTTVTVIGEQVVC